MARPVGSQTRLTKYTELVRECLAKQQHDPILDMIQQVQAGHCDPELRFSINKELAQYIAPKLKAVEMTLEADIDSEIKIISYKDATAADMEGIDR